jgi:hypothetical protein
VQDEFLAHPRVTVTAGLRYEFMTMPIDTGGRDSALVNFTDRAATVGRLYEGADYDNLSPRLGVAWDVAGDGRTAVRGGYGLYYATNSSQNLIVTVTNPPETPRVVYPNPTFPNPPFERAGLVDPPCNGMSSRRRSVWISTCSARSVRTALARVCRRGHGLLRGAIQHRCQQGCWRPPCRRRAARTPRDTIEAGPDGDSSYCVHRRGPAPVRRGWSRRSPIRGRTRDTTRPHVLLRYDQRHHVGVPEFVPDYNRGRQFSGASWWPVPVGPPWSRTVWSGGRIAGRLAVSTIASIAAIRSVFVQNNRSRSCGSRRLVPDHAIAELRARLQRGQRRERAPASGSIRGVRCASGRLRQYCPAIRGAGSRVVGLAFAKLAAEQHRLELRVEIFNVFSAPTPVAEPDGVREAAARRRFNFRRIRNTVTGARRVPCAFSVSDRLRRSRCRGSRWR